MSYSTKMFLLSVVLLSSLGADNIMHEYTKLTAYSSRIIGCLCVSSLVFIPALKAGMSIHIFGILISKIIPQNKFIIKIEATDLEKITIAGLLIILASVWLITHQRFEIAYPDSIIKALIISLIIVVATRVQTILKSTKSKEVV